MSEHGYGDGYDLDLLTPATRRRILEGKPLHSGVPAFTEANRRHVDPDACACRVNDGEIIRCALHAAAPKFVAALERFMEAHRAFNGLLATRQPDDAIVGAMDALLDCAAAQAEATIKEAKGEA